MTPVMSCMVGIGHYQYNAESCISSIEKINMTQIDLRHLRIFLALHASQNVSRAAETVGLSQSSVSVALGQLRQHYGDPLFVRTAHGMQATPRADQLVPTVRQALQLLDHSLERTPEFRPQEISREFQISMTDVGYVTLLPAVLGAVQRLAPRVSIRVRHLSHDTARQLELGEVDLAMGFTTEIKSGFYQQKLLDEGFACIASRRHPRVGDSLGLEQLAHEKHVKVMVSATAHSLIDRVLERAGVQRSFALSVPAFLGVDQIVASSELLAIIPRRLAAAYVAVGTVKVVSLPLRMPAYAVNQYWHERFHRDPASIWLRTTAHEAAAGLVLP